MIIAGFAAMDHFTRINTIRQERNVDVADGHDIGAVGHGIVPLRSCSRIGVVSRSVRL
jgi:hypothetical protein